MKKKFIPILTISLAISTFISPVEARNFTDINENDWFYETVSELTDRRIIKGYDDGSFKPYNEVTYAEFFTLLTNSIGKSQSPYKVVPRKWYLNTFNYLNKKGIPADEAKADLPINRAEMARFTSLALEKILEIPLENSTKSFKDIDKDYKDYESYIANLASKEIITGDEFGNFLPDKHLNRAEASQVIKKVMELKVPDRER